MMIVRALFFAQYRELAGVPEMEIPLAAGARVTDLVGLLRGPAAGLSALPESPAVAVNMAYAPLTAPLADGDAVAFIPPVAGG